MGAGVLTAGFTRDAGTGVLSCEGVPLMRIADAVGTPAYVYSSAVIADRYTRIASMLSSAGVRHRVHYTLKANSCLAILRLLRELGAGVDVVSGGELRRARRAGFAGDDIIFGGVGKTADELRDALDAGVLLINAESENEIRLINELAAERRVVAPVGIRVNPELKLRTRTHQYIRTGEKGHKFGVSYDDARRIALAMRDMEHVALRGLDMHLGSMLSRVDPYRAGAERLMALYRELREAGMDTIRYVDLGGGLGVRYDTEQPPDLDRFARQVLSLPDRDLTIIMEPGRFIVGNAGALLATVLYRKSTGDKEYVVTDAGMTELLRPSHYGAFHRIEPVQAPREQTITADVVGPVCESGDFLALDRELPDVRPGERIVVRDTGAYGYVMASNYNARRRPAEVLVDGDRFAVVTARESYEDLMRLDIDQPAWTSGGDTQP